MIYKIIKAKPSHSIFFYNLRNSKDIRTYSVNSNKINFNNHQKWFQNKINSKNYFLYLLTKNNNPIGYLRLKKIQSCLYLSISFKNMFRNKGHGTIFLKKIKKKFPKKVFIAEVLKKNLRSFYFFKKNGYIVFKKTKKTYLMKTTNKHKKYLKIINKISSIRKKNNNNWMDILKVAFKNSPDESAKIMSKIFYQDKKISELAKKLSKK